MFKQRETLLLSSNSWGRKSVLNFAKIAFETPEKTLTDEDEEIFKQSVKYFEIHKRIQKISDFKGLEISKKYPEKYVLSGDQACVLSGEDISKPKTKNEAIAQLTSHAGRTVQLITSATLCKNGEIIWQHQEIPEITLRRFSMTDAKNYVELEELSETGSVVGIAGACKVESPLGVHLLEKVEGNHHTIIGLPLNALVAELYKLGILY